MSKAQVVITVDENGKEDISVENLNVNYLPYLLGRLVNSALNDKLLTGNISAAEQEGLKRMAVDIFAEQLGVILTPAWTAISEATPLDKGPYLCKEKNRTTIYSNMYWDTTNNVFTNSEGTPFSFVTHWCPHPKD